MTLTHISKVTPTKNPMTIPTMKMTIIARALAMIRPSILALAPQDHSSKANLQKRGFALGWRNVV